MSHPECWIQRLCHIGVTCRELHDAELVEREDPGYYSITWRGRAYLEGELTLD